MTKEPEYIYLDNAATSWPKSRELLVRAASLYHEIGVSPGRGGYDRAVAAEDYLLRTRQKTADFFGAPEPTRVIFTANATDGINLALFGLLNPGDHVIATHLEHNSVLRPLYHLQQTAGVTVSFVPFNERGFIEPAVVEKMIVIAGRQGGMGRPALVVINHASNVIGTVQPVEQLGEICRRHDIPLLIDASQSAGHIPVSMERTQARAVVFTGHKALGAPSGIGGLVVHPDLDIRTSRFGGTGVESKSRMHTGSCPHRLEAGTHNLLGIIGLSLALDHLSSETMPLVYHREMTLARHLYRGLRALPGLALYGDPEGGMAIPLFSVSVAGLNPEDLAAILDGDFNIAARAGLHCAPLVHESIGTGEYGTVRFSIGRYNTAAQIDAVLAAVGRIVSGL